MTVLRCSLVLLGFGDAAPVTAVQLGKIDRTIAKEAIYKSKPQYCLLVFGPQAKTRVWLVLDGDVLYVDRNGNGDLTAEGERTDTREQLGWRAGFAVEFKGGTIIDEGDIKHTDLIVRQTGFGPSLMHTVLVTVAGKRRQYAAIDEQGSLHFAEKATEAPLVHFGGPLTMQLLPFPKQTLRRGSKGNDLTALIGTPGLGKRTFAMLFYDGCVPNEVHPIAEVESPPTAQGKQRATVRVSLTHRC